MTSDGFYDNVPRPTKQKYMLHGTLWDGFRSSAKWTVPAYALFFSWFIFVPATIGQTLFALLMIAVSSIVNYLVWRQQ